MRKARPAQSTVRIGASTARSAIPTMRTMSRTVAPSVQWRRLERRSNCATRAGSAPVAPTAWSRGPGSGRSAPCRRARGRLSWSVGSRGRHDRRPVLARRGDIPSVFKIGTATMPRSAGTLALSTAIAFARVARCTLAERPRGSRWTTAYGVATGAPNSFADLRSTARALWMARQQRIARRRRRRRDRGQVAVRAVRRRGDDQDEQRRQPDDDGAVAAREASRGRRLGRLRLADSVAAPAGGAVSARSPSHRFSWAPQRGDSPRRPVETEAPQLGCGELGARRGAFRPVVAEVPGAPRTADAPAPAARGKPRARARRPSA